MSACLVMINLHFWVWLVHLHVRKSQEGLSISCYGRVLKEVLPVTCFADGGNTLLQEPHSIKIEISTVNWEQLVNT